MTSKRFTYSALGVVCAAISIAPASNADIAKAAGQAQPVSRTQSLSNFEAIHHSSKAAFHTDGSVSRLYGKAFSHGATSAISSQRFITQNAGIWGVATDELLAQSSMEDGRHTQPIGYLPETDSYKFTGHYYTQTKAGIPVFRSKLVLLVRNEENNPLVLASSVLFDLSNYQPDNQIARMPVNEDRITWSAEQEFPGSVIDIESTERTIFAGTEINPAPAVIAEVTKITINGFEKYLVVTDALSGELLLKENLIHTVDISGNASALASEGIGSMNCEDEVSQPLPYLSVGVQGGNSSFTDINGDFTIPHGGSSAVTVNSNLTGQWFRVNSATPASTVATPPGPADLVFNPTNASNALRAQVNAYIEANRVRDFVVAANPSYPQMQQSQFPINVNLSGGLCPGNAWYDGGSINFCVAGGSNPNTAWSSVIHHEYGHHLVAVAGSGQGQYGEGMGDVMSTIILDDPPLGLGFFGSCNGSLRNADNNMQYPCGGAIHTCGQLISGAVWDTRNELIASGNSDYTEILNFLAVNAMLVHSGDQITPQITIDWLTLDDDDANIGNGTPHYAEIAAGFGAHNMDAPALNLIDISFPVGQPEFVSPNGDTTLSVNFAPLAGVLDASSPTMMVDTGSGFTPVAMSHVSGDTYEANFPASDCGSQIEYYIVSQTDNGTAQNSPTDAPSAGTYTTNSATGTPTLVFEDNFETNMGWNVSGSVTDGAWERGIPVNGNRGDPATDYDASGRCYVTDNVAGNSDVDGGTTILTSPSFDNSAGNNILSYALWYSNDIGTVDDSMTVELSNNNGGSWTVVNTVGPDAQDGGWETFDVNIDSVFGAASSTVMIRFVVGDLGAGSVVEAGVDAVRITNLDCTPSCPADLTGDGSLDFFDVSAFLSAFGAGDLAADFTGDGTLDFFDVSAFLGAFSAGCP